MTETAEDASDAGDTGVETMASPATAPVTVVTWDPNGSASHLLHRAQQMASDLFASAFGSGGLTQRQLAVLAASGLNDGATQTGLVAATGIDRSTLAEMVARMTAKGLLAREKSSTDSRANVVTLTAEGRAILDEAAPKLAKVDAALLSMLSARRAAFVDALIEIALPQSDSGIPGKDGKAGKKKKKKKDKAKKKRKDKAEV